MSDFSSDQSSGLPNQIQSPSSPHLATLCDHLAAHAEELIATTDWPQKQLQLCARFGVFRWFVPEEFGGFGWTAREVAEGYLKLGAACLTTTFVITQWVAAVKRILASENDDFSSFRVALIDELIRGEKHVTVGISHLTTSHRHQGTPALLARNSDDGFLLQGFSPWVSAAPFSDFFLIGATQENEDQILCLVPARSAGVVIEPSQALVALSASQTGAVRFENVHVPRKDMVAGPTPGVLAIKGNAGTGGLQTSVLALALSRAAIDFISDQSQRRSDLTEKTEMLDKQWVKVCEDLFQLADGQPACTNETLRAQANSLVLRTTQAALVAAKGAGFVEGHRVGRWCREALFFLVWSCPQSVQDANLCELAGIET